MAKAEILLFDLKSDRLVWSALSETFNPSSNRGLVREVESKVTQLFQTQFRWELMSTFTSLPPEV